MGDEGVGGAEIDADDRIGEEGRIGGCVAHAQWEGSGERERSSRMAKGQGARKRWERGE